jgi:septal ring-binding cell division protein DamX
MVDSAVNRQSSMDVTLEPQTQLVSRIGLALKNSNKLSFLHGKIGVGKSHVANLLQHNLSNIHVVKLQIKQVMEPEQLKQQIICELATDELSDLNQPISTAVHNSIVHSQQSILLIIDNAELIPQQALSALWQSIHELDRMNQTHFTFNVLLIGESRWALAMHHGLKNKADSLVAEFAVAPLTAQQATDFMMSVHTDWSDQKIQQFISKVAPEYLIPKQLIYAKLPVANGTKRKVLLFAGILVVSLFIVTVIVGYSMTNEKALTIDVKNDIPKGIVPSLTSKLTAVKAKTKVVSKDLNNDVEPIKGDELLSLIDEELLSSVTTTSKENLAPVVGNTTNIAAILPEKETLMSNDVEAINKAVNEPIIKFKFDEEYLLALPKQGYSLMLGGYSSESTLLAVKQRFTEPKELKAYQTIRNGNPWFVLLYGSFERLAKANKFVEDNSIVFQGFSPWSKPHKTIQQEINAGQLPVDYNKEDND